MTIQLTWDDLNSGAAQEDGFRVYRSTSTFSKLSLPSVLASVSADAEQYDDVTAPSGTNLFYMVEAYKGAVSRFTAIQNIVTASDQFRMTPETDRRITPEGDNRLIGG